MEPTNCVDLAFPLTPGRVPLDHGYALYSALSHTCRALHGADWLGIHPLSGRKIGNEVLVLSGGSELRLRIPADKTGQVLPLIGQRIRVAEETFLLGAPTICALEPASSLFSRQVVVRLTNAPQSSDGQLAIDEFKTAFAAATRKQLLELGISSEPQVLGKRVVQVRDQKIIGFSVQLDALTDEQSLLLQSRGLGGKRRMGCGVFRPARITTDSGAST